MNANFKYLIILILLVFSGACYAYSHVFWSATVAYSNFDKIGENVFVDRQLTALDAQRLKRLLDQAKHRIEEKYGEYSATPRVIITASDATARKFGLSSNPAMAHLAPWEQYLIIGPKAQDIDVIAHELFHAEVVHRLGYWAWQTKFPVWFNEGLAMQVDNRPLYYSDKTEIDIAEFSRISRLESSSQFWTDNKKLNIENYRLAKKAVAEVLKNKDEKHLYSMLDRIRKGEKFMAVFNIE